MYPINLPPLKCKLLAFVPSANSIFGLKTAYNRQNTVCTLLTKYKIACFQGVEDLGEMIAVFYTYLCTIKSLFSVTKFEFHFF